MYPSEYIDEMCEQMLGHTNWEYILDDPMKGKEDIHCSIRIFSEAIKEEGVTA